VAKELETVDRETGEVSPIVSADQPLAVHLAQAELNQAVTTARTFPRSITTVMRNIKSLATLNEKAAADNVYALPRGGKPIRGPSVRLAEIIASQWGNCHVGSRVVAVDKFEKVVIAEGVFIDLETGMKRTAQIQRRIVDKAGRLYNDDMITMTGNAAASIAMREAVLKGVPRAIWWDAYEASEQVIAGDIKTLAVRREEAAKAFAVWGITPEQIFASLEIEGMDDLGLDEVATLTAMYRAIKAGEQQVEDYFPAKTDKGAATDAAKGTAAKLGKIAEQGKTEGDKPEGGKAATDKPKKADKAAEEGTTAGKAAEGEKATGAAGEGAGEAATGDSAEADADEAGTADPKFTDEEIENAFKRGANAKRKGMSRKALPGDWRKEGMEPLSDAWVRGFTETEAPAT